MSIVFFARAAAFAVLAAVVCPASAQTTQKPMVFSDLVKPAAEAERPSSAATSCAGWEAASRAACENNAKAYFEHQTWVLKYRQEIYEAHANYTFYVFILVCAIVLLGMYLSLKQFNLDTQSRERLLGRLRSAMKDRTDAAEAKPDATPSVVVPPNQLELSATGIKVTSSVLGVIILVVSMGFFYLYLKTVYPIQETTGDAPSATAKAATPAATP